MARLTIECLSCGAKAELAIEAEAEMVLLNCFNCKKPILYYHGETTEVDELEMGKLQEDSMKAIEGFLKIHPDSSRRTAVKETNDSNLHQIGEPLQETPINQDDIANLKIDLHFSEDVLDIIKKL